MHRSIVHAADAFLLDLVRDRVLGRPDATEAEARAVLSRYLAPGARPERLAGPGGIYHHLAQSAQDYGMAPTVVGRAIGGVERLEGVLSGFDPARVARAYPSVDDWERLLDAIVAELEPAGKLRREPRSIWPKYCRSLVSGAHFLAGFGSAEGFYRWAGPLERDPARRAELAHEVERGIAGFGFALACLFLMELGYDSFLKPDVWVIRFCNRFGVTDACDPRAVFDALVRLAEAEGVSAFALDRMIWLIGAGKFWLDGVSVGSQLEPFAAFAPTAKPPRADRAERRPRA